MIDSCEIFGSHNGVPKDTGRLGYDIASCLPTVNKNSPTYAVSHPKRSES